MPMTHVEILRAACCVASLDGQMCDAERAMLTKLAGRVGAGQASLEAMIRRAESDPKFYNELFNGMRADAELAIRTLLVVAGADGVLSADERIVIGLFAHRLGMTDERYDALATKRENELASPQSP